MKANRLLTLFSRSTLTSLAICAAVCFSGASSFADTLPESMILPNFAVVSVGTGASLNVNSGPINGAVLIGNGSTATSAGGGNGQIVGGVFISPPCSPCNLSSIQIPPTVTTVASSVGTQAFADAVALSNAASALTPTVTLGNITGSRTFIGNGGLNVINIGTWGSPVVTLTGGANDFFVFNLTSFGTSNTAMTLNGILPGHILWNLTGTSGNIFQTSGGGCRMLDGTFLATRGGNFQFSNLCLTGQLINTAGLIQFVSGSTIPVFNPFSPPETPSPVPEPATLGLLGMGLVCVGWAKRRIRKPANSQVA